MEKGTDLPFVIRLLDPEYSLKKDDKTEYEVLFWPDAKGSPKDRKNIVITQKQIFSFKETEKQFAIHHGITLPDELKKKWREVVARLFATRLVFRDDNWIPLNVYQKKIEEKENQAEEAKDSNANDAS